MGSTLTWPVSGNRGPSKCNKNKCVFHAIKRLIMFISKWNYYMMYSIIHCFSVIIFACLDNGYQFVLTQAFSWYLWSSHDLANWIPLKITHDGHPVDFCDIKPWGVIISWVCILCVLGFYGITLFCTLFCMQNYCVRPHYVGVHHFICIHSYWHRYQRCVIYNTSIQETAIVFVFYQNVPNEAVLLVSMQLYLDHNLTTTSEQIYP